MKTTIENSRAGYSLVEVTLAILVVGIGLLSTFSLFPAGLNMNKRASEDTAKAIFAEEVFNGYHAIMDGSLSEFGNRMNIELPAVTFGMWDNNGAGMKVTQTGPNNIQTIRYTQWSVGGTARKPVEHALRYTLEFKDHPTLANVACADLRVWYGEFGMSSNEFASAFYTEFYDYGTRP